MALADRHAREQSVALLQRSLEEGRLAHAYLFAGARMEDLEDLARNLAKTLECLNPPHRSPTGVGLDSCDACLNCRKIEHSNHADVHWLRPVSKLRVIKIQQVRDLIGTLNLKATEARHKIVVLPGADRLTVQAANAFLKTLEEPPPKSVLLLLTTDPTRVLETVRSRCLRLTIGARDVCAVDASQCPWLEGFAEVAAGPQGQVLDRYRLLGTLLAELSRRHAAIEETLTAASPLELYDDAESDERDQWEAELDAAIEAEYRRQRSDILSAVQWWLRDIWLCTLGFETQRLTFPDRAVSSQAIARRISPQKGMENLEVMARTQRLLLGTVQEALALEVGMLELKL